MSAKQNAAERTLTTETCSKTIGECTDDRDKCNRAETARKCTSTKRSGENRNRRGEQSQTDGNREELHQAVDLEPAS